MLAPVRRTQVLHAASNSFRAGPSLASRPAVVAFPVVHASSHSFKCTEQQAAAVPPLPRLRAVPGSSHPILVPASSALTTQIKPHRPDPASTSVSINLQTRSRVRTISGQHRHAGKICNRDGRSTPADRPRPPPHRRRVAPQGWLVPGDPRQVPEDALNQQPSPGAFILPHSSAAAATLLYGSHSRRKGVVRRAVAHAGPGPSASSATSLSKFLESAVCLAFKKPQAAIPSAVKRGCFRM